MADFTKVHEEPAAVIVALLEARVQQDEGGRGIAEILPPPGELYAAATTLYEGRSIAIMSGFPCMLDHEPPTETDGPLGAMAIARACLALDQTVIILTDECNEEVFLACAAASGLERFAQLGMLTLSSFPGSASFDEEDSERLRETCEGVDVVIAIERAGPAEDGLYYTMRGRDMTALVSPLDDLLLPVFGDDETEYGIEISVSGDGASTAVAAPGTERSTVVSNSRQSKAPLKSICIGDGGNEVGMGKIYHKILASSIPNAQKIACVVPGDHLIVCSVSNWGGYALAAAVAVVAAGRGHSTGVNSNTSGDDAEPEAQPSESSSPESALEALVLASLPSDADEERMCERIVSAGARDGITGANECMVDGMPLEASLVVLRDLRRIATSRLSLSL